jgi:hypothetical protein
MSDLKNGNHGKQQEDRRVHTLQKTLFTSYIQQQSSTHKANKCGHDTTPSRNKISNKKGSARKDRASEKSCCNDEKRPRSARGRQSKRTQGRWSIGKRHFLKGCLQAHRLEARCARKRDTYISAINIITRLSLMETRNGALLGPPPFACSTLITYLTSKIDTEVRFLQVSSSSSSSPPLRSHSPRQACGFSLSACINAATTGTQEIFRHCRKTAYLIGRVKEHKRIIYTFEGSF